MTTTQTATPERIRMVERKIGSNWYLLRVDELEVGDIFRMTEADKEPVRLGRRRNFIVMRKPYLDDTGFWNVDAGVDIKTNDGEEE